MVRVLVSKGTDVIVVPHVVDVIGVSNANGRYGIWDTINSALCYDEKGAITVRWSDVHLAPALRGKVVVSQSPGR